MRPELDRLLLIEQQLLDGPAALPAEEWHLRQLLDGELAADTEAQLLLYQGLRLAGRQQLRRELRQIHAQLYAPRTTGWLAGLRRWWAR
ncbi:hypothetical protein GO988_14180 [Hymenobacter sp. HMF4947]|uniref:Uncharacterized protein n=1 Tax=Hymenobacter ginkgonis TaxID=2682976 RepID=A0A7K1TGH4_9BACT|nr:hypothetical protein [Hymenobacter ginkgonis]MVN77479.1 hypothetical protein [Hymenobacter ginkgonis]